MQQRVNCAESFQDEVYLTTNFDYTKPTLEELNKWKELNVYEEVEDVGQKCINTRWVNTVKGDENNIKIKSRLVARGFEEEDTTSIPKQGTW